MGMIDLKQVHEHSELETYSEPDYPYGTRIDLDGEVVEALGLNGKLPAGQKVTIQAIGIVYRRSEALEPGGDSEGKDTSVCIQITNLDVKQQGSADSGKAATMLYGDSE